MKILYGALKFDYGDKSRGYSYEHYNFYETLSRMGNEIIYFDFMTEVQERGKESANRRLVDLAKTEHPDLVFCSLFTDQIYPDTIRRITRECDTTTFNWFTDDHWRFEQFSRYYAPAFSWVSTTADSALPKYYRLGYTNVIKTQWACNHWLYQPKDLPLQYDVSFVGQVYGKRRAIIQSLRDAGIKVNAWGQGWEGGRVDQDQMIDIFGQSRINLNLSAASTSARPRWWPRRLPMPFGTPPKQIKGRVFEVPGCGGFLLTDRPEYLDHYYKLDKEVGAFDEAQDLPSRVKFYLSHEDERATIAGHGYRRTLADHTYQRRFSDIFARMGLLPPDIANGI